MPRALRLCMHVVTSCAVFILSACSSVGTGTRALIRAECPATIAGCPDLAARYPHLVVLDGTPPETRVLVVGPNGVPILKPLPTDALARFAALRTARYRSTNFASAELSLNIHDRNTAPALLAFDVSSLLASTLSTFAAANTKEPLSKAIALQRFLQARLRNTADLPLVITPHHQQCGVQAYYYYPRLSLDFGSVFSSPSTLDRLDFLAVRLTLRQAPGNPAIRIIDYTPKAADFADYTRGQFTAAAQLQAQLAYSISHGTSDVVTQTPNSTTTTRGVSVGPQVSGSISDSYVAQLTDAIDRRTAAILDDGRTFFADFRGIRQVRVGGTYNFDVMLEVPATLLRSPCSATNSDPCPPNPVCNGWAGKYISQPVAEHIVADATLIGVVRHVYRRGHIGAFTKVPEPENDDVFEEVVLKQLPNLRIWDFNGEPAYSAAEEEPPKLTCTISATTNRDDSAVIVSSDTGAVLGRGTGREATISFATSKSGPCKGTIAVMPIVVTGEKGEVRMLAASLQLPGSTTRFDTDGIAKAAFTFPESNPLNVIVAYRSWTP
jgi:hypothetical protein